MTQPRAEQPTDATPPDDAFTQSFAASDWAEAFVKRVRANPDIATDVSTMLGWFANAIMRGYDEHARRAAVGGTPTVSDEDRDTILRAATIVDNAWPLFRQEDPRRASHIQLVERLRRLASRRTTTGLPHGLAEGECYCIADARCHHHALHFVRAFGPGVYEGPIGSEHIELPTADGRTVVAVRLVDVPWLLEVLTEYQTEEAPVPPHAEAVTDAPDPVAPSRFGALNTGKDSLSESGQGVSAAPAGTDAPTREEMDHIVSEADRLLEIAMEFEADASDHPAWKASRAACSRRYFALDALYKRLAQTSSQSAGQRPSDLGNVPGVDASAHQVREARELLQDWIDGTDWDGADPREGERANAVAILLQLAARPAESAEPRTEARDG